MSTISYTDTLLALAPEHFHGFFVGWPNPPSPETHLRLLRGSDLFLLAIDDATGNVVGFVTAITDGVLAAYISFLEVLPGYRKQGIGSELMRRIIGKLRDLYAIDLLCDEHLQPYYERLGMRRTHGMALRNYERMKDEV